MIESVLSVGALLVFILSLVTVLGEAQRRRQRIWVATVKSLHRWEERER